MTVQIAREAQVAAGQLHHHFTSIGELKAQVFIRLIRDARYAAGGRRRQLARALVLDDRQRGWPAGTLYPPVARRPVLADSDPDIKAAYLLTMNMWHEETVAIIEQGLACGEFRSAEPAADIAWRFIALVCGLDGIYALDAQAWMMRRLAI
jgi:AcrR family transcriptional regulator